MSSSPLASEAPVRRLCCCGVSPGELPVPLPYLVPNEPRTTVRQLLPGGGKCCHSPSAPPQQKVKNAAAAPTGAGDVAAGNDAVSQAYG